MKAVLALGSNLGHRFDNLQGALDTLFESPGLEFIAASPVYETEPFGGDGTIPPQGPYLNAVVLARTTLSPRALLERALEVENAYGRVRTERWGPRTLDIDLIVVGDTVSGDPDLTLPHPRAHERAFVLVPWADIDPAARILRRGAVADLLAAVDRRGVRPRPDLVLEAPA